MKRLLFLLLFAFSVHAQDHTGYLQGILNTACEKSTGRIAEFPVGRYKHTGLIIPCSWLRIKGQGPDQTILDLIADGYNGLAPPAGVDLNDISLEDMSILASGIPGNIAIDFTNIRDSKISNVKIWYYWNTGINLQGIYKPGISRWGPWRNRIDDVVIGVKNAGAVGIHSHSNHILWGANSTFILGGQIQAPDTKILIEQGGFILIYGTLLESYSTYDIYVGQGNNARIRDTRHENSNVGILLDLKSYNCIIDGPKFANMILTIDDRGSNNRVR